MHVSQVARIVKDIPAMTWNAGASSIARVPLDARGNVV
jgi:hypothetical protein